MRSPHAKDPRLVVASAEPEPIVRTYLQQYGVNADKVTSGVAVATRPTPTLVLVEEGNGPRDVGRKAKA